MNTKNNSNYQKENKRKSDIPFIIFLIICIPILIINLIIIIKGNMNPDKVPDVFGYKPFAVVSGSMETSINVGKRYFATKGDNNKSNDMDPVVFDKIEGVYVTKYAKLGNFVLFIQKPIGFIIIMIIILLIGVILFMLTGKSKSRTISDDELKDFEEFKRNRNK